MTKTFAYCRAPFLRATNLWIDEKKGSRKQFSWIYIGDAHIVTLLFLHKGIITFSAVLYVYSSRHHSLQKRLLASNVHLDAHWDKTNWQKFHFGVVNNSGMHIARSFYMLTTYQYFRCSWHINWSGYTWGFTSYSYKLGSC